MRLQRGGVSLFGLIGVFAGALVLLVAVRVAPAYVQHRQVMALVEEVRTNPDLADADKDSVVRWLGRAFKTNNLWELQPEEIIGVKGRGSARQITVDYEVTKPMFYNMSLVISFKDPA